jgi:hypothetical protein
MPSVGGRDALSRDLFDGSREGGKERLLHQEVVDLALKLHVGVFFGHFLSCSTTNVSGWGLLVKEFFKD